MKSVTGYLSKDGKFFETDTDCEKYESEIDLRYAADKAEFQADSVVSVAKLLGPELMRFINANLGQSSTIDGGSEAEPESLLEQPTGSYEPMPDVGSGTRPKTVRKQRKSNGP